MSLNWNFETDFIGTWTQKYKDGEKTYNMYSGNALFITLNEYKIENEEYYTLINFAADIEHFKNCLGITKGFNENIYDESLTRVALKANYRHTHKIVAALAKAKFSNDIDIKITSEPW